MPNSEPTPPGVPQKAMQVLIVTGLSGSGKSTAIHVLEDLGFYCIDNLPVTLIPRFLELCANSEEPINRVALGIDLRERVSLREYPAVLADLRQRGHRIEILYLEAADEVLVRRFSETRRPHPAARGGGILQGIRSERERLTGLRELADQVIDTSAHTVHELRDHLQRRLARVSPDASLLVSVESFGYKYGVPTDADVMLDVRFLPNPFFVEELRAKSGVDPEVAAFVRQRPETKRFLAQVSDLLESTLPLYVREGKSYLTLAVGCTGGRHRSVVVAEELKNRLAAWGYRVQVRHRDLQR
jgi:RNase adapter protein RapZ